MQKFIIFLLLIILIFPAMTLARIGVGVGTGIIKVDQVLKPGGIYDLPTLTVFNTGDEPFDYEMEITYLGSQTQLRPPQEWFNFSPSSFYLEPQGSQPVAVQLTLPVKTTPGDYLAYLEVHPAAEAGTGTSVGIAAATKLYFTVEPANFWQALTFRVSSFWTMYSPWTWVVLGVILIILLITLFKKKFAFQLGVKKK